MKAVEQQAVIVVEERATKSRMSVLALTVWVKQNKLAAIGKDLAV